MTQLQNVCEGEDMIVRDDQGRFLFYLAVMFVDRDYIHLRRNTVGKSKSTDVTYRYDRRSGKLYVWAHTGWDTLKFKMEREKNEEESFMGD